MVSVWSRASNSCGVVVAFVAFVASLVGFGIFENERVAFWRINRDSNDDDACCCCCCAAKTVKSE